MIGELLAARANVELKYEDDSGRATGAPDRANVGQRARLVAANAAPAVETDAEKVVNVYNWSDYIDPDTVVAEGKDAATETRALIPAPPPGWSRACAPSWMPASRSWATSA